MRTSISILLALIVWLAVAVAGGCLGIMASAPGAAIGFVNFALTFATLVLVALVPSLRAWTLSADLRPFFLSGIGTMNLICISRWMTNDE